MCIYMFAELIRRRSSIISRHCVPSTMQSRPSCLYMALSILLIVLSSTRAASYHGTVLRLVIPFAKLGAPSSPSFLARGFKRSVERSIREFIADYDALPFESSHLVSVQALSFDTSVSPQTATVTTSEIPSRWLTAISFLLEHPDELYSPELTGKGWLVALCSQI